MIEIWKPVVDVLGYEISSFGQIRRCVSGPSTYVGKLRKTVTEPSGHQSICMSVGGQKVFRSVHRLVLEAFVGPCPVGMESRHLNGNPADNRRENLKWGTRVEQRQDDIKHGRSPRGERHSMAKLTASQAAEIRKRYIPLDSVNGNHALAVEFGVSHANISFVVNKKTYRA